MQAKFLQSALFAGLAALLLDPSQAPWLLGPLRAALSWGERQWPDPGWGALGVALQSLPTALAVFLLLLIPITWLKPH
jgi:hypothetical protein